jgi:hypothetical protein
MDVAFIVTGVAGAAAVGSLAATGDADVFVTGVSSAAELGAILIAIGAVGAGYTPDGDDRLGSLFNDEKPKGEILTAVARAGTVMVSSPRLGEVLGGSRSGDVLEVKE